MREVIADLSFEFFGMNSDVGTPLDARPPITRGEKSLLDRVDLSARAFAENANSLRQFGKLTYRRTAESLGKRRNSGTFAVVALGAVLVSLSMAPWIKPGLESMSQWVVSGRAPGGNSRDPKIAPVAPAVTASPGVQPSLPAYRVGSWWRLAAPRLARQYRNSTIPGPRPSFFNPAERCRFSIPENRTG